MTHIQRTTKYNKINTTKFTLSRVDTTCKSVDVTSGTFNLSSKFDHDRPKADCRHTLTHRGIAAGVF